MDAAFTKVTVSRVRPGDTVDFDACGNFNYYGWHGQHRVVAVEKVPAPPRLVNYSLTLEDGRVFSWAAQAKIALAGEGR